MGAITLDYEDSIRILADEDAGPNAHVIAACAIAFFVTKDNADHIDAKTRAIALKLSRMVAAAIDATFETDDVEDAG